MPKAVQNKNIKRSNAVPKSSGVTSKSRGTGVRTRGGTVRGSVRRRNVVRSRSRQPITKTTDTVTQKSKSSAALSNAERSKQFTVAARESGCIKSDVRKLATAAGILRLTHEAMGEISNTWSRLLNQSVKTIKLLKDAQSTKTVNTDDIKLALSILGREVRGKIHVTPSPSNKQPVVVNDLI